VPRRRDALPLPVLLLCRYNQPATSIV
jgi:hypothetical protein